MSAQVISKVWKQVRDVKRRGKADNDRLVLLLVLAGFASDDGRCSPSIDMLAQVTELTHDDVRGQLDALEKAGRIRRPIQQSLLIEILIGQGRA